MTKTSTIPSPALLAPSGTSDSAIHPRGLEMRRASTSGDWQDVRLIRYQALRARDEIAESGDCAFGDEYDAALNSVTLLLLRNGRAVASTRSGLSSAGRRWRLPATEIFRREIEASIGLDATIVEASLTAVDPACGIDPKAALFHLLKAHMLRCACENADWLVTAVREPQIGFYRRMFNMEILSGAERWPGMAAPRVLMGLDYREQAPLLFKRIPVLAVTDDDERDFAESGVITFRDRRAVATATRDAALVAGD
jgi:hypothetical protein